MPDQPVEVLEPLPATGPVYDAYDGPLCRCGHYVDEHHPRGKCYGTVGDDVCTCQGHCEAKRSRR